MLTTRDISVLMNLSRYFLLNRKIAQMLCFPTDGEGRITRRRLLALVREGYINRHRMQVINPSDEIPSPVYYLAERGRQFLAEHLKDDTILLKPISITQSGHIFHYLAVTQTHILLDQAAERHSDIELDSWINEFEIANPQEPDRDQHFSLFSKLRDEPAVVCAPDAAFQLSFQGHRGVFYVEQDRDTSGHQQVARYRHKGYAELLRQRGHRRHFPTTTRNSFNVLLICPSEKRRDALRRAFRDKEESGLWLFASMSDLTVDSFLSAPIFYRSDDQNPRPLVRVDAGENTEAA